MIRSGQWVPLTRGSYWGAGTTGEGFSYRIDPGCPTQLASVEADGKQSHSTPWALCQDHTRHNRLATLLPA
ncbi:hypothetical protein GCM10010300_84840 [Streptomyces olivaceoviridis]|uniref:hypothetical protein n=1 Tax=Streptomyces olivaceoviridis TaxID=1921 RepID=UPI0016762C25|nr:hypothetical protein [Streptomyces olivaceoviridis]GGZ28881.1 hypothetical protein GCM10010300_84840 [Streptomyces olivaceoviridis]